MSVAVTLAELADVAFRTPRGCSVNAGALQLLLRGLLEHLRLQDAATQLSEDERGLLQPEVRAGPRVLLHPSHPGGPLGVTDLPSCGQGPGVPAADTEQIVQLRKRIEVIEEGMTKVTDTLQEVLTNTCSLKTTIQAFQEELQLLKDGFQKSGLEELQERAVQQDKHSHLLQSIVDQMAEVRQQLSSFPWQTGMLCSLCRLPAGEKLSSQELIPEASQEPALEAPSKLSWLLEQHEGVETCITCSKSTLQQHAGLGTSEDVAMEKMQGEAMLYPCRGSDFGREVLNQVGQLQEQCTRLQEAAEQLWGDSKDTQKADETTLETKASQDELQSTMAQLSEMMQDLLRRMFLHGQDRHKASELMREMNSKAQRQQTWRRSKQCHCQRPYFDTSSANGSKRHLFEPMKCISCDRPLAAAPRPPLVTVRKASLHLQGQRLRRSTAMEGVLYGGLPREAAKELRLQPQGSEEAKAFVSAFLKRSMPQKKDEAIQDVLTRKAVVLEHHCRRRKQPKRRKTKTFTAKQRRELRLFEIEPEQQRYELFLPLHELWKQYIRDLCYGLKPDAQPQMVQSKLLKADLHGAIVTVTKSKCPSYVGITGIILQEFKHVFKIITKDNKLKVVPKMNNVFSLETDGFISYIYGSKFQFRASERSAKKFKLKGTIDL